ncbi:helix-turn-helix transcriptional regulator [Streptomyces sp. NBC_01775]|uniref:helix-turn-helix domain-containing protein n=1 Tax=Streptomyces sp. NBC_01775 TaxID=2975939 RepID=UPI002DDB8BD5|nr:helix-turn-helix transcriptional regulator [Streptomyces sp. NBC_01775]WSB76937.1 helix-turn-helix transcriptional regulator [Streptomyces sp. NBC_01775]
MTDEDHGPDPGLEEDDSGAVMRAVGRMIKVWREGADLKQAELGARIGYGEEMVSAVERGRRVPKPEFLDNADEVLGAEGKISAMKEEVAEARYPKRIRDLAKLERDSVEVGAYEHQHVHALLQTEEYARALFGMRRPLHPEDVIERNISGRLARQRALEEVKTLPILNFVQEEVTLLRPLGGRAVHRRQLERLLVLGKMRNVEIQVMPTNREDHAGMAGAFQLFKLRRGSTLGYSEAQHISRLISKPHEVQSLEMQYGIIRAQALTPQDSLSYIEKVLGET